MLASGAKYVKWGAVSVGIMLVVLTTMTKFSDPQKVGETLGLMGVGNVLAIILFGTASLLLRNYRWQLLLRGNGFRVGYWELFPIFAAGQAASLITPGKSGDLLGSYGLKTAKGFPIKRTFASIFVSRFVDFFMILLFVLYGFTAFGAQSLVPVLFVAAVMVVMAAAMVSRGFARVLAGAFRPLLELSPVKKLSVNVREFYHAVRELGKKKEFYAACFWGAVIWLIEFGRMAFTVGVLGGKASFPQVTFAYCVGILVGMATLLPGGAGGFEASYMAIMNGFGVGIPVIASTLIIERVVGYGFALLIGFVSMRWVKLSEEKE